MQPNHQAVSHKLVVANSLYGRYILYARQLRRRLAIARSLSQRYKQSDTDGGNAPAAPHDPNVRIRHKLYTPHHRPYSLIPVPCF
jgi:hypothetical protein